MRKVNYVLTGDKEEKTITLLYSLGNGNKRFKMSTGLVIHPSFWNSKQQRVKGVANRKYNAEVYNAILEKYAGVVRNCHYKMRLNDDAEINENDFRKQVKLELGILKKDEKIDFISFINQVLEERKKTHANETLKTYITTKNKLLAFNNGKKITFSQIDKQFWFHFQKYLSEQGLLDSTIRKYLVKLKTLLNYAKERGVDGADQATVIHRINVTPFLRVNQFLTQDELEKLYKLDLSSRTNKKYERVRDLFYIGAYTGLRHSDLVLLDENSIMDNFIFHTTKKTKQDVHIPIKEQVWDIIKKYGGCFPRGISNQKTNKYLKIIARMAGIDEMIKVVTMRGNTKEEKILPKYELITTHTARRSFATNAYLSRIEIYRIMMLTGHKTETQFLRYIGITEKQNAQEMVTHPFFS
jgi:integrase